MNSNELDPELLKKMMLGGFSSSFTDKSEVKKNRNTRVKKREIDLHFNKLYPDKSSISTGKELELQLEALDHSLQENQGRVKQLIVIVGKGEGKLKKAVSKHLTIRQLRYSIIAEPPYFGNALRVYL